MSKIRYARVPYVVEGGKDMPVTELESALNTLGVSQIDMSDELGVTPRTVRRWIKSGIPFSPAVVAIRFAVRLHRMHLPWRINSIPIGFGPSGAIVQMTDDQAVGRRLSLTGGLR